MLLQVFKSRVGVSGLCVSTAGKQRRGGAYAQCSGSQPSVLVACSKAHGVNGEVSSFSGRCPLSLPCTSVWGCRQQPACRTADRNGMRRQVLFTRRATCSQHPTMLTASAFCLLDFMQSVSPLQGLPIMLQAHSRCSCNRRLRH